MTDCRAASQGCGPNAVLYGRPRLPLLGEGIDDERPVRDGADLHSLFEQSSKQKAAKFRAPPIEAERKLVEVALQVIPLDSPLVGSQKPPLQQ